MLSRSICTAQEPPQRRVTLQRAMVAVLLGLTILGAGVSGYQRLFSTFNPLDDEGYVLISLKGFLQGNPLYDQTYSQYGPAFFEIQSVLHRWTGLPLTHDAARFKCLFLWLGTALAGAAFLYRMTRSKLFSFFGFLLCFFHLERIVMEPGHPQELCVLLVVIGLCLLTFFTQASSKSWAIPIAGVLCGTLAMTKINMGVFLSLAFALTMTVATPRCRLRTVALVVLSASLLLLPLILLRSQLAGWPHWRLPAAVLAGGAGSLLVALRRGGESPFALYDLLKFGAAFLATCCASLLVALAHGTSPQALVYGLLLQHAQFGPNFYIPAPLSQLTIGWAILALVAAALTSFRNVDSIPDSIRKLSVVILLGAGLRGLLDTTVTLPFSEGGKDLGLAAILIGFVTPLVWVVLCPSARGGATRDDRGGNGGNPPYYAARLGLCFIAVLQPLGAFPIPGTQLAIGSVALLLAAILAAWDLLETAPQFDPDAARFRKIVVGLLSLLLVVTLFWRDIYHTRQRMAMTSLNLPGSNRLRLPDEQVSRYRWLVGALRSRAETFVALPYSQNSAYFWTQLPPPTGFNATLWPYMLGDEQQQRIIDSLQNLPRTCVVRDGSGWHKPAPATPLVSYLRANFGVCDRHGTWEVWERRPQARRTTPRDDMAPTGAE